jgi:hypothetical protein
MRIIRWLKYRLSARSRKREALREQNARIVDARLTALLAQRIPLETKGTSMDSVASQTEKPTASMAKVDVCG